MTLMISGEEMKVFFVRLYDARVRARNYIKEKPAGILESAGWCIVTDIVEFLFDDRGLWIPYAFGFCKERFGASETEVHVEAHGQVVGIVGDVEGDDLFFFAVLIFYE